MTAHDSSSTNPLRPAIYRLAIAFCLLCGLALRLYLLGRDSLWYDETVSAYMARQTLAAMLEHTALDIHPPGYYAMLHLWTQLSNAAGSPGLEYLLAFPSVFFGVLSLALLVPLGRSLVGGSATSALAVLLAAINPFLIWYAQEVRMYTLAGFIALFGLLAAQRFARATLLLGEACSAIADIKPRGTGVWLWLAVYVVAAAAGLYTLYYVAFALFAINLAVLFTLAHRTQEGVPHIPAATSRRRSIIAWLSAQLAVVLLFSAWLPFAVRQVLDPPVPPWRQTWSDLVSALYDVAAAISAYIVGQSVPDIQVWFWASVVIVLTVVYYGYTKSAGAPTLSLPFVQHWLPLYLFVPPLCIFLISALIVPIFHVRYLATYAPAFSLVAAGGLLYLYAKRRALFAVLGLTVLIGCTYSVSRFWRNAEYRPDDHRSAVAYLAEQWRPGDAILANAGWVYTAIDTYWPDTIDGPYAATPPNPVAWRRLTDTDAIHARTQDPVGLVTGSVDGDPSLGWDTDSADFYAISEDETLAALDTVGRSYDRIWHYRLYDTVSDPRGLIREWLDTNERLESSVRFGGTGSLLLEQYSRNSVEHSATNALEQKEEFAEAVSLGDVQMPEAVQAGDYLYVPLSWQPLREYSADQALATSVRLTDQGGNLWAQHDQNLPDLTHNAIDGTARSQTLALPIPASTPPGEYDVRLVVYERDKMAPLQPSAENRPERETVLGPIRVHVSDQTITLRHIEATFDYIDLVQVLLPALPQFPGETSHFEFVWRPRPSPYRDVYDVRLSLVDASGATVAVWDEPLGPPFYPSSVWQSGYPVRDQVDVLLPGDLQPGVYDVWLEIVRESDDLTIPASVSRWWPLTQERVKMGTIRVAQAAER